jgi:hypothetical protein
VVAVLIHLGAAAPAAAAAAVRKTAPVKKAKI